MRDADKRKVGIVAIIASVLLFLAVSVYGTRGPAEPLRLYVVSDAHVGNSDRGGDMFLFAEFCELKRPDIVLDLGDTIEARITGFYDKATHREASLAQQRDWLAAWQKIDIENKAVALGNRDVGSGGEGYGFVLSDEEWINALGYHDRSPRGGTKLQGSFRAGNDHLEALVFVICIDSETYDQVKTMDWIASEITDFQGDWIVFASHRPDIYTDIRDSLIENEVKVPAIFLHGHDHGPDTLVRDAWGSERELLSFPSYLITPLMGKGVAAGFELYPDGEYENFRLDVRNQQISQPVIGYQQLKH